MPLLGPGASPLDPNRGQAIWCTPVVSDWYKSAPRRQCVLRNILTIPATFLIKYPSSNNVITVLGAKRFRALATSVVSNKKDCARVARQFLDNFNLMFHEMRPLFQHCDNPVWVRDETLVSQAILCTSVIFHNARTVLGSRGEAPKSQFGALVHWFEIETYQHRKDSVCAKRANIFNNSKHISHEMPLF